MKKVSVLCLATLMSVGLCACGGSSAKDDVIKRIGDKGYVVTANIREDKNNFYDDSGKCYTDDKEVDCRRIIKTDRENDVIQIAKDDVIIRAYIKEDKVDSIDYSNDEGFYTYDVKNKSKYTYIYMHGDLSSCYFSYEGEKKDRPCDENRKDEADAIKKPYDDVLKDLDLSEDELVEFFQAYVKNEMKTIADLVEKNYKDQKAYTDLEIENLLNDHFRAVKTDGGYMLSNKEQSEYDQSNFMVAYDSKDPTKISSITYYNKLFSGSMGSDDLLVYIYYPEKKQNAGVSHEAKCVYDMDEEESIGKEECTEDQINSIDLLKYYFENELGDSDLTIADLVQYFTAVAS